MTLDIPKPNDSHGGEGRGGSYTLPPPPSRYGPGCHYPNVVVSVEELSGAATGIIHVQPTATQDLFISAMRNVVLSQDVIVNTNGSNSSDTSLCAFTKHRINPVVLRDDFVIKACNFMEMCQQGRASAVQQQRGHIKIDQAFRSKGSFVEGWIFVRWMQVGWSAAGFKPHRLGSLPLVMFPRKQDNEEAALGLQETLDKIMHEVYPVLVECFPECHIVPVQSCQELWTKPAPRITLEGSELTKALERAAEQRSSNSFTLPSSESNRSLEVPPDAFEPDPVCTTNGTTEAFDNDVDVEAAAIDSCITAAAEDTTASTLSWQAFQCKVTPFNCFVVIWALCIWAAILFIICWVLSRTSS